MPNPAVLAPGQIWQTSSIEYTLIRLTTSPVPEWEVEYDAGLGAGKQKAVWAEASILASATFVGSNLTNPPICVALPPPLPSVGQIWVAIKLTNFNQSVPPIQWEYEITKIDYTSNTLEYKVCGYTNGVMTHRSNQFTSSNISGFTSIFKYLRDVVPTQTITVGPLSASAKQAVSATMQLPGTIKYTSISFDIGNIYKDTKAKSSKPKNSHYPHICPKCTEPAYLGITPGSLDCSNLKCTSKGL